MIAARSGWRRPSADLDQVPPRLSQLQPRLRQAPEQRYDTWCGECDKCLFINLMLAPFFPRAALRDIFHHEPLSDPARDAQLRVLVGVGAAVKPFECVGDPDESAVALTKVSELEEWRDDERLAALARGVSPDRTFDELLVSPRTEPCSGPLASLTSPASASDIFGYGVEGRAAAARLGEPRRTRHCR